MYAVIHTGGKQYRVTAGQRLAVERLSADADTEVNLRPVLVVDGDTVLAGPEQLKAATVTARVVGATLGEKIQGFTYKAKSNQRRRWGHRQQYSVIEITGISADQARSTAARKAPAVTSEAQDTAGESDAVSESDSRSSGA